MRTGQALHTSILHQSARRALQPAVQSYTSFVESSVCDFQFDSCTKRQLQESKLTESFKHLILQLLYVLVHRSHLENDSLWLHLGNLTASINFSASLLVYFH